MASTYHYQRNSTVVGPVDFRELVRLVRDDELGADDPVKANWETDWHAAAEVVGLFHMAGREDVLVRWELEQHQLSRNVQHATDEFALEGMHSTAEANGPDEIPSWQKRLNELEGRRIAASVEAQQQPGNKLDLEAAIAAGLKQIEAKANHYDMKWPQKPYRFCRTHPHEVRLLHTITRWMMALIMANAMAFGVWNWSQHESLRFPEKASHVRLTPFPFVGKCSAFQYAFLMGDLMLASAGLGYGFARLLESATDG